MQNKVSSIKNGVFWNVTLCGSCKRFLQELHSVISQKTQFFIVTVMKTSNITYQALSTIHVMGINFIFIELTTIVYCMWSIITRFLATLGLSTRGLASLSRRRLCERRARQATVGWLLRTGAIGYQHLNCQLIVNVYTRYWNKCNACNLKYVTHADSVYVLICLQYKGIISTSTTSVV
jgi:hypothetical protein